MVLFFSPLQNSKTDPFRYLSFIFNHEGPDSLISYLRKQLWAVELSAGIEESTIRSNALFSLFMIRITLTDDGFDHLDDVLETVFGFLKFLQTTGPSEESLHEIQGLEANTFHLANERNAADNVECLVRRLKQYPSKYVLVGDSMNFDYDLDAIQKIIDEINSQRFNIMITSTQRYDDDVTYESTEPWFDVQYTERIMPEKWIELWKNAKPFNL